MIKKVWLILTYKLERSEPQLLQALILLSKYCSCPLRVFGCKNKWLQLLQALILLSKYCSYHTCYIVLSQISLIQEIFPDTPLNMTAEILELKISLVQAIHLSGKPLCSIILIINSCSTLSKAFSKSNLRIMISLLD